MLEIGSQVKSSAGSRFMNFKFKKELILFLLFSLVSLYWFRAFWARTNFQSFDWIKENFYFSKLRDSLSSGKGLPSTLGEIPHNLQYFPALQSSISYLGNPETLAINPFIGFVLLPTDSFFKLFFAAHLAVAILGIVLLSRKLNWSGLATGALFIAFILSPWMMQHIVLGYTPWVQIYWLPLAAYFLFDKKPILSGVVLSITFWSGAFHVFFWVLLSLGFLILFVAIGRQWFWFKNLLAMLSVSILLSGIRALFILQSLSQGLVSRQIANSYDSIPDVYGLLADGYTNPFTSEDPYSIYGTSFYDSSFYIGWYGLLLFFVAIVIAAFQLDLRIWLTGVSGIVVFFILGWSGVWAWIYQILPLVGAAEVYPYRFLPVATAWGLVIAVVALNRITSRYQNRETYLFIATLLLPLLVEFYQRNSFFLLEVLPQR